MHDWEQLLEPLRRDRTHGSSQLYSILLENLCQYLSTRQSDEILPAEIASTIAAFRPEMACFRFLAQRFQPLARDRATIGGTIELCRRLQADQTRARARIARKLWPIVTECRTVMLHSNSGLLEYAVTEAFTRETTVYISEGRPDGEGLTLAAKLAAEHFTVVVFPDDARISLLGEVDIALLGADWVAESDFTNKIGTYALCRLAAEVSLPVYVLADATKFCPARLRPALLDPRSPSPAGFQQLDRRFEITPNKQVTGFVTENGVLTPAQIASQIETLYRSA